MIRRENAEHFAPIFIAEGLLAMRRQLGKRSIHHIGIMKTLNPGFSISEYISLKLDDRKRKEQRCPLSWRPNSRKVPRGLQERSLRRKEAGLLSGPRYKQLSHWLLAGLWAAAHGDSRGAGAKVNIAVAMANVKWSRMHKNRQHDVSDNNKGLRTEVHTFYDFGQLCFCFL